jgi:hypothetical protein
VKFDHLKKRLAHIEAALVALRPKRKVLRVIIDQGVEESEVEAKMEAALAEHVGRYPEDAGRAVADFDWITWVVLPIPDREAAAHCNNSEKQTDAWSSGAPASSGNMIYG